MILDDNDSILDGGIRDDDLVKAWIDILKCLSDVDKLQDMYAAQKVEIKWSIDGDENSNFFHPMLKWKRRKLVINGLLVDGGMSIGFEAS